MLFILGFLQMRWNVKRVHKILVIKVIVLNATSVQVSLYFNTKMPGKRVSKTIIQFNYFNYYKGEHICEGNLLICSPWKSELYIISYPIAEKEGRLDIKGSTGRPNNVTQRVESKMIKTVYDSPQSSTRGLAFQVEKNLGLRSSHDTIRNVLEKHKYSSRVARKKPLLSAQNVEKRLDLLPNTFYFHRSTGMMLFSQIRRKQCCIIMTKHQRVWRKSLTALENKNLIPTVVKLGKFTVMV